MSRINFVLGGCFLFCLYAGGIFFMLNFPNQGIGCLVFSIAVATIIKNV
jgi:hypothetical protein